MERWHRGTTAGVVLALLCSIGLAAQTWSGQFLSDDATIILSANQGLAEQHAFDRLLGAFVDARGTGGAFYRPIGQASWLFSAWVSGIDPAGWRIFNVLLHLLNGGLLYRLVMRLAGTPRARASAGFAMAAFWLYPLAPEASVWIAGRYDLLALAGALLACERHLASRRLFDTSRFLSLAALAFALGCKEAAITAPALFFLLGLSTSDQRPEETEAWRWLLRSVVRNLRDCLPAIALLAAYFLLRKSLFGDALRVYSSFDPLLAFAPAEFFRRLLAMAPVIREPFGAAAIGLIVVTLGVLAAGCAVALRSGRWLRWWLLPGLATALTVFAVLVHFPAAERFGMDARFFYASGAWLALWLFLPFAATERTLPRTLSAVLLLPTFAIFLALAIAPWRDAGRAMRALLPAIVELSAQLDARHEYGLILVPDHLRTAIFARNAQGAIGMGGLSAPNAHADSVLALTPLSEDLLARLVELGGFPVAEGRSVRTFCFDAHADNEAERLVELSLTTPMNDPLAWWSEWSSAVANSRCAESFTDLK